MTGYNFESLKKDLYVGPVKDKEFGFVSRLEFSVAQPTYHVSQARLLNGQSMFSGYYNYKHTRFPGSGDFRFTAPLEFADGIIVATEMVSASKLKHCPMINLETTFAILSDMPELEDLVANMDIQKSEFGPVLDFELQQNNGDKIQGSRISTYVISKNKEDLGFIVRAYQGMDHTTHMRKTISEFTGYDIRTAGGSYCWTITNTQSDGTSNSLPYAVVVTGLPSQNLGPIDKRLMPLVANSILFETAQNTNLPTFLVNGHPSI